MDFPSVLWDILERSEEQTQAFLFLSVSGLNHVIFFLDKQILMSFNGWISRLKFYDEKTYGFKLLELETWQMVLKFTDWNQEGLLRSIKRKKKWQTLFLPSICFYWTKNGNSYTIYLWFYIEKLYCFQFYLLFFSQIK